MWEGADTVWCAAGPLQHLQIDYATEPTDCQPHVDQPTAFQLLGAPSIHRYLWSRFSAPSRVLQYFTSLGV